MAGQGQGVDMTKEQIDAMVQAFLRWKLPETFNPDNGIEFKRSEQWHTEGRTGPHWPIGTNLLTYAEAKAMVEHMLEALAQQPIQQPPKRECGTCRFKLGDGKCHNCLREIIQERLEYLNWQPKEGA